MLHQQNLSDFSFERLSSIASAILPSFCAFLSSFVVSALLSERISPLAWYLRLEEERKGRFVSNVPDRRGRHSELSAILGGKDGATTYILWFS